MDPDKRAAYNEKLRERYRSDPEYRERRKRMSNEWAKRKYWDDPAARERKLDANSAYNKAHPDVVREAVNRYRATWPDRVQRNDRRQLLHKWGLTEESYALLLHAQGGVCAICRGEPTNGPGGRLFAVDHDHRCCPNLRRSCGKCVRGLLCHRCNVGLAHMNDSADQLRAAADYLERTGSTQITHSSRPSIQSEP